ncbi:hypothetical protein [Ruminococcus sp. NK3A76]|uniref:hypothetical protein n=1 Tax=Ruminococcus sp. NK3A76 TaxID=877411 RepID=UPI00049196FC|nr:hypothetical protein [Ruminococcus sp. NK3A76]
MTNRAVLLLALLALLLLVLRIQSSHSGESFLDYLPETEFFSDNKQTKNVQPAQTARPVQTTAPQVTTHKSKKKTTTKKKAVKIPKQEEVQVFKDDRIPDFKQNHTPEYKDVKVEWTSHDQMHIFSITMHLDRYMYEYYHSLARYYDEKDYQKYIDDSNNREILKSIADSLKDLADGAGYDGSQTALEAISFVQAIKYVYDIDSTGKQEFPKYPLETLYDLGGDCEDTSLLLIGILRELNFGTCLLDYDDHVAIGIMGEDSITGSYFEVDGKKYFYVESTGEGWTVGEMPDDVKNRSAQVIKITG